MARVSKEANRAYYKKYYAEHKPDIKRNQKKYEEKHPRVHVPDSLRGTRLKYLYKINEEGFDKLFAEQGNLCALCDSDQSKQERRFSVDHDHRCCLGQRSCGKCLRGILCADCNRKLGFLEATLVEALVTPFPQLIGKPEPWTGRAMRYLKKYAITNQENQ